MEQESQVDVGLNQLIQPPEPQHFVREKRLGILSSNPPAIEFAHGFDHVDDRAAVFDELGAIGVERGDLRFHLMAYIQAKRRLEIHPKMCAEIIDDPLGIPRFAGYRGFGQLGIKAGIFADAGGCDMIGVRVDRIGQENPIGLMLADDRRHTMACFE